MKKICFVDRDGTLLLEPPKTQQINSLAEMVLVPNVISSLKLLCENGWELVMVTNQDGLGTHSNPRDNYDTINEKLFEILKSEGVEFLAIFEDDSFADNPSNNRKPNTGMVDAFLRKNNIDYEKSFMVGDRSTDIEFADNLEIKGFLLPDWTWQKLTDEMINAPRRVTLKRETKETQIEVNLNLDGSGKTKIKTGLNFFDHMLDQIGKHAGFDLEIVCQGDLEIDEHHTIEDTALLLGEALQTALGDKRGIERYASEQIIVMDESKCEVALDISGRPYLVFDAHLTREYVGDFPTELLEHFFYSLAQKSGMTLNIKLTGENDHHLIEVAFKGLARALRAAVKKTSTTIPSTKGTL
jgi:imidazoleglycerol-phosphate dehydratase/histidinol-phosphatase